MTSERLMALERLADGWRLAVRRSNNMMERLREEVER
jgi:hypothetical protein